MTDYSIYADFLARLQAATSEEEKSWMLMEFSLNQLSPTVREAVWAAAIPHQFDEKFLRTLLENNLTAEDWKTLLSQSYLEHLWNGGYAVHESTRKLLLAKLFQDDPQRYRELNRRAANYCEQQNQEELRWRVATLYHQALADLDGIADEFDSQVKAWWRGFQRDKIEALIRPMLEEVTAHRVNGKIIERTYYWQGVLDDFCGRPSSAKNYFKQAIQLFQQLATQVSEAWSIFRLGDGVCYYGKGFGGETVSGETISGETVVRLGDGVCYYGKGFGGETVSGETISGETVGGKAVSGETVGGKANYIRSLGDVHLSLSGYEAARTAYQQALPLYQQIGDKLGEANCIKSLGDVHLGLSDYEAARTAYQQALPLFQQIGSKRDEANCIKSLGDVYLNLSDYEAARTAYQQALPLYQQIGDKRSEANCIKSLGNIHLHLSDYESAWTAYQQALPLYQQIGSKRDEANCIKGLGDVHLGLSDYEAALTAHQQALPLFQQTGDKLGEANCIYGLGQILAEQEDIELAIQTFQQAAELYHAIDLVVQEAGCFDTIANVYRNQKRYEESLVAYQQVIAIAPEGGYWYHNRARTYIAMRKYALALQDIEQAERTGIYLEYLQKRRGEIALWQHQPQIAVDLLQSATQQRPKDGDFQRPLALALLANGNAEAFATMETGLKLTYRKKDIEGTLEDLDKLVRIYGERAEFAQMREVLTNYLNQNFQH